jgi:hypothetical protein
MKSVNKHTCKFIVYKYMQAYSKTHVIYLDYRLLLDDDSTPNSMPNSVYSWFTSLLIP